MKHKIKNSILKALIILLTISCSKDEESEILQVLEAPANLVGSDDFALKVELNWDAVPGTLSYSIYRKDISEEDNSDFALIGAYEENHYVDLEVESNEEYQYYVKAMNGMESEPSNTATASTREITTEETFDVLAEYTGGVAYETPSASQLSDVILTIIENHVETASDLVFLIDNTGSMSDDIENIQMNLTAIINALPPSVRVGVAEYGDNNVDDDWYDAIPLSLDYDSTIDYINNILTTSGGDIPESVYDGIYETIDVMNWSSLARRIIVVIGDAPPLEGDLTNHTLSEVINYANEENVSANMYPILVN